MNAIKTFEKAGFIYTGIEKKESVFGKESIAKQMIITKEIYIKLHKE